MIRQLEAELHEYDHLRSGELTCHTSIDSTRSPHSSPRSGLPKGCHRPNWRAAWE